MIEVDIIIITRVHKNTDTKLYTYKRKPNAREYDLGCVPMNTIELCSLGHELELHSIKHKPRRVLINTNKLCSYEYEWWFMLLRTRTMICVIENTDHSHKNTGRKPSPHEFSYKDSKNIFYCKLFWSKLLKRWHMYLWKDIKTEEYSRSS